MCIQPVLKVFLGSFNWKQFEEDGWQHPKVWDRLTIAEMQSTNVLLVQSNTLYVLEIDNTPPSQIAY